MTRVKFCGLSRESDIEAAQTLGADMIGFVFYKKSHRYVSPVRASELRRIVPPHVTVVGVFVNDPVDFVADLLNRHIIDMVQLHGSEDEAYIGELRVKTGARIIQGVCVKDKSDLARAASSTADYVLLDSKEFGSGRTFDWTLLKDFPKPYILAGGLTAQNVAQAVRELHPYAVDVSSGIETNQQKSFEKMAAFMAALERTNDKS